MYTLRKEIHNQEQINTCLGNSYSLVKESMKTFTQHYDAYFKGLKPDTDDVCYAFVISENGKVEPLWESQKNYIMTESGKTFSNLSFK